MGKCDFATALASADIAEFLRIEREGGRDAAFAPLDVLAANLMSMALSGRRLMNITPGPPGRQKHNTVTTTFLTPQDRALVDECLSLANQQ